MTRIHSIITGALLLAAFIAGPRGALAAGGVADHANIFKPQTITTANDIIQQIKTQEHHDVRVETFATIPDDQKAQYAPDKRAEFFAQWAQKVGRDNSVTGIVILICMDPGHMEMAVGNQTQQRAFTTRDRDDVRTQLVNAFKEKNYDAGILDALRTIDARMVQNIGQARTSNSTSNYPAQPGNVPAAPRGSSPSHGFPIGGLVCLVIGAIIVVMLLAGLFKRNRGYGGGGYNAPPPGGYPPGYVGGGYPQGGYQGGGGGFGRGLLGGLLGGALGAWGYDRFSHPNQGGTASGGYVPPPAGDQPGMNDSDSSYSSSGGDFGSSDSGGGGGGDFGGGGGDSGGGGGDSGGGSGGDF